MASIVRWADVEVGTELPAQSFHLDRASLVRYAGASGDFNVIHWNERVAREVGLPERHRPRNADDGPRRPRRDRLDR